MNIPDDIKSSPYAVEFQYALNVVARIISMNYHISFDDTVDLLVNVVGKLKVKSSTSSDLIHDCVKYIIAAAVQSKWSTDRSVCSASRRERCYSNGVRCRRQA